MLNKDEIYTATEMARNFSSILKKLNSQEIKKAMIVKNNKFEAVMLSMSEYERLEKAVELLKAIYGKKGQDGQ
ncbi:type II toxin-antitoxin system Phd/YefM family antitoxin [Campylobacter sp. JMF_01 NE2]|nr:MULTISPECIES: prevent-host-death protein [unclassified Campylobacter]MBP3224500.1 type II toxin-antitoxin system Phd/YefM family antitoxin [Campylobacter sp.]MDA3043554.1 type II toxin-antitoxin system Phd/YefM family antitoxin [Campylobacter sp. JMF_09 ED2]MDA3044101.1 type II toxin-antitoxin system Phd/YefM family antitoxin [Campylobacter sp. JMF_07 ED4]MDA3047371.1 type II toxin-antitoxin system Phd/YefM family antitoxin [Campylobacter sp. JMF_08 NE1]MDA3049257.1 type II toxin-antitoxin 